MSIAARVAKPHIIACSSSNESWSDFRMIYNPASGRIGESMLEEDRWALRWNSKLSQYESIVSDNSVLLEFKSVLYSYFGK